MRQTLILAWVAGSVLLAAGCTWITPVKDRSRFFVLPARPVGESDLSGSPRLPPEFLLGVGPVRMPLYLKQPEIVEGLVGTQVRYSPTDRWAEPLAEAIATVIAAQLTELLGVPGIADYPWAAGVLPDYAVPVRVLHFESDGSGTVRLEARWAIRTLKRRRILYVADFQTTARAPTPDTSGAIAAMSAALAEFSQEIAGAIQRLAPLEPAGD